MVRNDNNFYVIAALLVAAALVFSIGVAIVPGGALASDAASLTSTTEQEILSYVMNDFSARDGGVEADYVRILESGYIDIYDNKVFYAEVQVDSGGRHGPFYYSSVTDRVLPPSGLSFEGVTGISKVSYELWNALKTAGSDDQLPLIISVRVDNEITSIEDKLPHEKMDRANELRSEIRSMEAAADRGESLDRAALDSKTEELENLKAQLASEVEAARLEVIAQNKQVIQPAVNKVSEMLESIPSVQVKEELDLAPSISVVASASAIEEIAAMPEVSEVALDIRASAALNWSAKVINADDVWNHCCSSSIGTGATIAVLDTGISGNSDVVPDDSHDCTTSGNTNDQNGHGTLVAGIAVSTDSTYQGISKGADLMNGKVAGADGVEAVSDMKECAQWAIDYGANIINHSFNCKSCTTRDGTSSYTKAVDYYVDKYGILWVNSGGNQGEPGAVEGIHQPADAYNIVAVGSTVFGPGQDYNRPTDLISFISPSCCTTDDRKKPDVVAPGENIWTTTNSSGFANCSGNSCAAPHVAGIGALVREDSTSLSGPRLKAIILNAANYDTTTGEYNSGEYDEEWGWGYVDAWLSRVYDHVNSITVSEDQHKYRYVTLDEGERFVMTLTWNRHMSSDSVIRGTSNFDLYVYDPSGNPMWPTCSTCISEDLNDNVEVVYFTAPADGKYKIDIYGRTIVPTSPTGSTDRYYAASTHTLSSS